MSWDHTEDWPPWGELGVVGGRHPVWLLTVLSRWESQHLSPEWRHEWPCDSDVSLISSRQLQSLWIKVSTLVMGTVWTQVSLRCTLRLFWKGCYDLGAEEDWEEEKRKGGNGFRSTGTPPRTRSDLLPETQRTRISFTSSCPPGPHASRATSRVQFTHTAAASIAISS